MRYLSNRKVVCLSDNTPELLTMFNIKIFEMQVQANYNLLVRHVKKGNLYSMRNVCARLVGLYKRFYDIKYIISLTMTVVIDWAFQIIRIINLRNRVLPYCVGDRGRYIGEYGSMRLGNLGHRLVFIHSLISDVFHLKHINMSLDYELRIYFEANYFKKQKTKAHLERIIPLCNSKLLFMSATPMIQDPYEHIKIMRLFMPRSPLEDQWPPIQFVLDEFTQKPPRFESNMVSQASNTYISTDNSRYMHPVYIRSPDIDVDYNVHDDGDDSPYPYHHGGIMNIDYDGDENMEMYL